LKLAEVDKEGIFRFKYWKGNEVLKVWQMTLAGWSKLRHIQPVDRLDSE